MSQADMLARLGKHSEAADLYVQASEFEAAAFQSIPHQRQRTRGVIAVSAVALLYRAGLLSRSALLHANAARLAHYFLSLPDFPDAVRSQLTSLLQETERQGEAISGNQSVSSHGFSIALAGKNINGGLAPVDAVSLMLDQIERYVYRMGEFVANIPFRQRGSADSEVMRICRPLISPPSIGSYRFDIRIGGEFQLPLLSDVPRVSPDAVVDLSYQFITLAVSGNHDDLVECVPDEQYRINFLKQIRNIVPTGRDVSEIVISKFGTSDMQSVELYRETLKIIQSSIPSYGPAGPRDGVLVGTLRGFDLDKNWIVLRQGQLEQRCVIRKSYGITDDVITPLGNHRVRVMGHWEPRGTSSSFVAHDISPDDGEPADFDTEIELPEGEAPRDLP